MPWDFLFLSPTEAPQPDPDKCKSASPGPHQLLPSQGSRGFELAHWGKKWYLEAVEQNQTVVFRVNSPGEWLYLFYWRSRILGFGQARCWFDGDSSSQQVLDGHWDKSFNMPEFVICVQAPLLSH